MSPGDVALVTLQLCLCALVGWASSGLLLRWAGVTLDLVERAVAAVAGIVGFAVAGMVLNLITGGAVFGLPGVVPVLAAGLVAAWVATGTARVDVAQIKEERSWRGPLLLALGLAVLYLLPVLLEGSGVRTGDPPWHLGWTEQLLGGEPVPVGPAPELARNAYPWGYHALLAALVRLLPGTDPLLSHETVHVAIAASIPLVGAAIARRADARAGLAAAACTGLVGGFGWILARGPDFVTSPRSSRFGADLVVASPNSVYELFPPALPREVGLVLAGVAAVLLAIAASADARRLRVLAGAVIGLVGVVSVPMFFTAIAWGVATSLVAWRRQWRAWVDVAVPAVTVFALWAGPVAAGYLQHGGFVDITPRLGMEWPLPTALGAYGLLLPVALGGAVVARRLQGGRVLLALCAATVLLLSLAVAREVFGWTVWNNATLLHQGRMWPPVHLLAGALGGVAVVRAYSWVRRRWGAVAPVAAGALLVVGGASPALASLRMREVLDEHRSGFEYGVADLAEDGFVARAARRLEPDDVVAVAGSDELAWMLFQLSGARLARYDDPRFEGNDLRIRFADLAREWDERVGAGGFAPTHVVLEAEAHAPLAGEPLVMGTFDGVSWTLYALEGRGS